MAALLGVEVGSVIGSREAFKAVEGVACLFRLNLLLSSFADNAQKRHRGALSAALPRAQRAACEKFRLKSEDTRYDGFNGSNKKNGMIKDDKTGVMRH